MKIKVIDLLNKIANKEELPKKIKYENVIYEWDECGYLHFDTDNIPEKAFLEGLRTDMVLNTEVEILEDEEIDIQEIEEFTSFLSDSHSKDTFRNYCNAQTNKINEIIRVVNKIQEKEYYKESEEN